MTVNASITGDFNCRCRRLEHLNRNEGFGLEFGGLEKS